MSLAALLLATASFFLGLGAPHVPRSQTRGGSSVDGTRRANLRPLPDFSGERGLRSEGLNFKHPTQPKNEKKKKKKETEEKQTPKKKERENKKQTQKK